MNFKKLITPITVAAVGLGTATISTSRAEETTSEYVAPSEAVPTGNPARVVVSIAGRVVADTRNALTVREATYPPVQYIPSEDVDFSQLERTDHTTYCPYKGDCSYYSIPAGGNKSVNAVWSYEDTFPAVAQIRGMSRSIPIASMR